MSRYRPEPIISLVGGYQRFFTKKGRDTPHTFFSSSGNPSNLKSSQILYKQYTDNVSNAVGIKGFYTGNFVAAQVYAPEEVGAISKRNAESLEQVFFNQYRNKASGIVAKYMEDLSPRFEGVMREAIRISKVDTGEEQHRAIGARASPKPQHGRAEKVDLVGVPKLGSVQVTTRRLDRNSHHGIYGLFGKKLVEDIQYIRTNYKSMKMNKKQRDQAIADKGLQYFQGRLPTWNTALKKIRNDIIKAGKTPTAGTMRKQVFGIKSDKISPDERNLMKNELDARYFAELVSSGPEIFAHRGAAEVVLQSLGNISLYNTDGVAYSYPINPYTYAVISQFLMTDVFEYQQSALKHAEVVDSSFDVTDSYFAEASDNLTKHDVAMKRNFAHNQHMITKQTGSTETMSLNTALTGGLYKDTGRLQGSVDLQHVDKELAKFIKKGLIPAAQKKASKEAKKFRNQFLNKFPQEQIYFPKVSGRGNKIGFAWATPYIGAIDAEKTKFGGSADFD